MCFKFRKKTIMYAKILKREKGFTEEQKLSNLVVGHSEYGFDGMVIADIFNNNHSNKTTFQIYYSDNTSKIVTVNDDSFAYQKYIKYCK